jgi:hypothetical protein
MEYYRVLYEELILTTLSYVRLVYTSYLIYSVILLKSCYKEYDAGTEKNKFTKV